MNPLAPTPGPLDLRFRLFGVPVRIQPSFWLIGVIFGWLHTGGEPRRLLTFLVAICLATLVHEMGHALLMRAFRARAQIILFSFGGAAFTEDEHLRGWQRLLIALSGPAAGFAFFALLMFAYPAVDGWIAANPQRLGFRMNAALREFFNFALFMSLIYNILNLLPIYPLDGGQVVRELCLGVSPSYGVQISLVFSMLCAGFVAIYSLLKYQGRDLWYPPLHPLFNAIFFGLMAVESLTALMRERRPAPTEEQPPEPQPGQAETEENGHGSTRMKHG